MPLDLDRCEGVELDSAAQSEFESLEAKSEHIIIIIISRCQLGPRQIRARSVRFDGEQLNRTTTTNKFTSNRVELKLAQRQISALSQPTRLSHTIEHRMNPPPAPTCPSPSRASSTNRQRQDSDFAHKRAVSDERTIPSSPARNNNDQSSTSSSTSRMAPFDARSRPLSLSTNDSRSFAPPQSPESQADTEPSPSLTWSGTSRNHATHENKRGTDSKQSLPSSNYKRKPRSDRLRRLVQVNNICTCDDRSSSSLARDH